MVDSNYPDDWQTRRYKVFKRDGFECQGCGEMGNQERPFELHCHHVKPIAEDGGHSHENLITLCGDCHRDVHNREFEVEALPAEKASCSVCDRDYWKYEGFAPGYCSKRCKARKKANKALKVLYHDKRICATCFNEKKAGSKSCDKCGSWHEAGDQRSEFDLSADEIDIEHLLTRIMYWVEFGN